MIKVKKIWTVRYILDRIQQLIWMKINKNAPWWTRYAIKEIENTITNNMKILEFGGGRSTSWLANRAKNVTCIETDSKWIDFIVNDLRVKGLDNVKILQASSQTRARYQKVFNLINIQEFDLIIIDGKFRDTTALKVLQEASDNAIIMIDDVHLYLPCEMRNVGASSTNYQSKIWLEFDRVLQRRTVQKSKLKWFTDGIMSDLIIRL